MASAFPILTKFSIIICIIWVSNKAFGIITLHFVIVFTSIGFHAIHVSCSTSITFVSSKACFALTFSCFLTTVIRYWSSLIAYTFWSRYQNLVYFYTTGPNEYRRKNPSILYLPQGLLSSRSSLSYPKAHSSQCIPAYPGWHIHVPVSISQVAVPYGSQPQSSLSFGENILYDFRI